MLFVWVRLCYYEGYHRMSDYDNHDAAVVSKFSSKVAASDSSIPPASDMAEQNESLQDGEPR